MPLDLPAPVRWVTLQRMRGRPVGLILWLTLLAVVEVIALLAVLRFFVRTAHGQSLDFAALTGNSVGQTRVAGPVGTVLTGISAASLVVATAVVGFIALARRRFALAVGAILLIGGANATAYLLKSVIVRPNLGVDMERAAAGNSLPSGHATVAASVAVALLLVLPSGARGLGAVLGALFAAVAGTATLSAGWHRPSDAVAALLIVGAWACVAGVFVVAAQHRYGPVDYGPRNRVALGLLVLAGLLLLVGAVVALLVTDYSLGTPVADWGRRRLFTAYAGGAMEIAGTAALVFASVLATARRVVPHALPPDTAAPAPALATA